MCRLSNLWVNKMFFGKGRLRTLSSTFKSRKFDFRKKIWQRGTFMLSVLSFISTMFNGGVFCIITWRGLTCVAYPCERQCESLNVG